jgi:sugar phosphate isomerase/epimerase
MTNDVYVSSAAFRTTSSREMVSMALRYGITHIELSASLEYSDELLNPIRATKDRIRYLVHNYFPTPKTPFVLNLASTDPEQRRMSMDLCENAIRLSVVLGAPFYSVHAGTILKLKPEDLNNPNRQVLAGTLPGASYEEAYRILVDSLGTLNESARQWGIQLLVENSVVTNAHLRSGNTNTFLLTRAEEFERLKKDIPDDNLGFLIDLAHLEITSNALYYNKLFFLERIRSYIYALHLSENDGQRDTNEAMTPISWFVPILKTFPGIPMIVEVNNLPPEQIKQQIDLVQRYRKPGTGVLYSPDDDL